MGHDQDTKHQELIAALRDQQNRDLPDETRQVLRDAEAALVRQKNIKPSLVRDFADTSFVPGQCTREALIEAALNHIDEVNAKAFLIPVPNTTPEIVVALGEPRELIDVLASRINGS